MARAHGWLLALALLGCDRTPESPTAAFCAQLSDCPAMELLVAPDECQRQLEKRVLDESAECKRCVLALPCAGVVRLARGEAQPKDLCRDCSGGLDRDLDGCPAQLDHALVCGVALVPSASASASAAAPPSAAAPSGSAPPKPPAAAAGSAAAAPSSSAAR